MLILVLSVLTTSCRSSEQVVEDSSYQDALRNMIPALPAVPELPVLNWQYKDGLYCLSETDVDLFLDYKDNTLPRFKWEMDQYRRKLEIVIEAF
jgi:hypothetical protein